LRNTNLETSLAGVTLLLLPVMSADLAARGLASRRLSLAAGHCCCRLRTLEMFFVDVGGGNRRCLDNAAWMLMFGEKAR